MPRATVAAVAVLSHATSRSWLQDMSVLPGDCLTAMKLVTNLKKLFMKTVLSPITAFVLFNYFDLYQVVWMAAVSNFIVAMLAYVEGRRYV